MSTAHRQVLGSVTVRKRVNSRVRILSGAKPVFFFANVAPAGLLPSIGSLFPRFRPPKRWSTLGRSGRQNVQKALLFQAFALHFKKA